MNPLESRKQLLIAESELNRAQLVQEWQTMTDDVHALARKARINGSRVSIAASLVAGLAFFRRKKSASAAAKPSWLQTILKGAGLFSAIWSKFRPRSHNRDKN
ncbi:MAG TPA: hypothetical protein VKA67_14155 [Verrucomicrobiae bacterium]|nr:hypothetical protein [Verrucomicrobiae bacterium]